MGYALVKVELIPRSRVFARAEELKLAPTDERLEAFRKAGLMRELPRIEGTTQRGFTPEQGCRFLWLLWLCTVLRKPRPPALAFWLCWYGFDGVSPDLICEHIEATIISNLRNLRREFIRKNVPIHGVKDPAAWLDAAKPFVKFILKHNARRPITNPVAIEVLSSIIGLALRALISKSSFEAVSGVLGRLAYLIGIDRGKTDALRELWLALREGMELFDLDERKNPLVKAIREVHASDPKEIWSMVRDSRPMHWISGTLLPILRPAAPPLADDPKDKTAVFLAQRFAPGAVGVLALCRNVPHTIELRRQFREGNFQQPFGEYHQVKVIINDIAERIGVGANNE